MILHTENQPKRWQDEPLAELVARRELEENGNDEFAELQKDLNEAWSEIVSLENDCFNWARDASDLEDKITELEANNKTLKTELESINPI